MNLVILPQFIDMGFLHVSIKSIYFNEVMIKSMEIFLKNMTIFNRSDD